MAELELFLIMAVAVVSVLAPMIILHSNKNKFWDAMAQFFPKGQFIDGGLFNEKKYVAAFHQFTVKAWLEEAGSTRNPRLMSRICIENPLALDEAEKSFGLRLSMFRFFWENMNRMDREEFMKRLQFKAGDRASLALKHDEEFLSALSKLTQVGDVDIRLSEKQLLIKVSKCPGNEEDAIRFIHYCLKIFQKCGQVAAESLDTWRGVDFWSPNFIPRVDGRPCAPRRRADDGWDTLQPGVMASQPRRHHPTSSQPEAYVLCSRCFEQLGADVVRCPSCNAGHHARCVTDVCSECRSPMAGARTESRRREAEHLPLPSAGGFAAASPAPDMAPSTGTRGAAVDAQTGESSREESYEEMLERLRRIV